MKFKKALEIINFEPNTGFMVSFEVREGNLLRS